MIMDLPGVIRTLNKLRVENVISDYAIMGGTAVNYYIEPTATLDVDIVVLLKDFDDYHRLYATLNASGYQSQQEYIIINDTRVQVFPSFISQLYQDSLDKAKHITIRSQSTKVVRKEHLIAFLLLSYRLKDKIRVFELLKRVDLNHLREVLSKYENPSTPLNSRLDALLG